MKRVFYYHPTTGAIESASSVTGAVSEASFNAPPGLSMIFQDCEGEVNDLVVDLTLGCVVECEEMPLVYPNGYTANADGIDEVVILGLPVGTRVLAQLPEGQAAETVDDGAIELRSLVRGIGRLTLYHPLYKPVRNLEIEFL